MKLRTHHWSLLAKEYNSPYLSEDIKRTFRTQSDWCKGPEEERSEEIKTTITYSRHFDQSSCKKTGN